MRDINWDTLSPLEDAFCLDDDPFAEAGEIEEYRKVFRRLMAAVLLEVISTLHSKGPRTHKKAEDYLRAYGPELLKELGIRNIGKLESIIANPPERKALRCSNGRRERKLLHGQKVYA